LEEIPGDWQHRALSDRVSPSDSERQALEVRHSELVLALRPANDDEIKVRISAIRMGFPATPGTEEYSAERLVQLYASALAPFPLWAIDECCRLFIDGRVPKHNNAWAPTPPEMAVVCRGIVDAHQTELSKLSEILGAKVYHELVGQERDDHDRRLVACMRWEKEIRPAMVARKTLPPKETPEQALARLAADKSPIVIDEPLGKKLAAMKGRCDVLFSRPGDLCGNAL
jgi:hypothetical protein